MDDILEKYPEFENKLYIIGGSRREALREAMAILLRLTNRCCLSTEWFCLQDNEEQIRSTIDEVAAATGRGKSTNPLNYSGKMFITSIDLLSTPHYVSYEEHSIISTDMRILPHVSEGYPSDFALVMKAGHWPSGQLLM